MSARLQAANYNWQKPTCAKTQVLPFLMVFGVFISLPVTETESSGKVSVKDRSSPSPCIEIRLALSTVGCLAVHRSPISRIDRYSGNP